MNSFRNHRLRDLTLPTSTTWLLTNIAAAALVLDFPHPFRDGNGRVSRLLTLLALYQHGYEVGRYISLERLTEESKEDYYKALQRSSQRWHEGKPDLTPWLNFFLAINWPIFWVTASVTPWPGSEHDANQ
jgi:fido (protein-threonine AMPylation protein)